MSKMSKRIISILLSLLMTLSVVAGLSFTSSAAIDDPWDGTIPTQSPAGYSLNGYTYSVGSAAAFIWFLKSINGNEPFVNRTVQLTRDIDLNGHNIADIWSNVDRSFKGVFDGQGHTIRNINCATTSRNNAALFTKIDGATIRNVNLEKVNVDDVDSTRGQYVGGVVGYATGSCTFENVHVNSGVVKGRMYLGGILGYIAGSGSVSMTNCSNGATVYSGVDQIGGLLGGAYGAPAFTNCYNTGAISGTTTVGGLLGYSNQNVSMTGCYNTGNVTATSPDAPTDTAKLKTAGGLLGYYRDNTCTLTKCNNLGLIRGNGHVGGLVGINVGTSGTVNLDQCFNMGNITSYNYTTSFYSTTPSFDFKGGLLGFSEANGCSITNSYNWGAVVSGAMAGGIFGGTGSRDDTGSSGTITINNCYSAGKVHGNWAYTFGWANGNAVPSDNKYLSNILDTANARIEGTEISAEDLIANGADISTYFAANNDGVIYGVNQKCYYPIMSWLTAADLAVINDFYQVHSVAHKGYQMVAPGNTLPAYVEAGKSGFWGAECDIHPTADGHWVLGHDNDLSEMTDATGTITSKTLAELQAIPITKGNYISQYPGLTFCTVEDYLAVCAQYGMRPVIEIKDAPTDAQLGSLATLLLASDNVDDIIIIAQEASILPYLRSLMPDTQMYYCTGQTSPSIDTIKDLWLNYGIGWDFHYSFVTNTASDGKVREALTYGVPMMTWTMDDSYNSMTEAQRTDATYAVGVRRFTSGSLNLEAEPPTDTAQATMYATRFESGVYRNTVNYTIHNLTTGSQTRFTDNTASVLYYDQGVNRRTYQTGDDITCSTGTLEIDRAKYSTVEQTGLYIEYTPHVYTPDGNARWGVELFPYDQGGVPAYLGSLGGQSGVASEQNQRTVTSTEGNNYTYELHFGSPSGPLRCAETSGGNFTLDASVPTYTELDYGPYKWYITGPAPAAGESVTLRVVAICYNRVDYNNYQAQMLSEWTDITITGTCSHPDGFTVENPDAAYLNTAPDCEHAAIYYYSCPYCGEAGTNTFSYGAPLDHDWGDWNVVDDVIHQRVCANDSTHVESEPHTFGDWFNGGDGYSYQECDVCGYMLSRANTYTITFDTAGGSTIDPITADYGDPITAPAAPTREGYYFLGWLRNGSVDYVPATMPAESYTLTANWFRLSYQVSFDTDGAGTIDPINVPYGDPIPLPDPPEKTDYIFMGWGEVPDTMPAENITLTAIWEPVAIVVRGESLTLNGDIGVNFYVDIPNATADTYATFTVAGETRNVPINLNKYGYVEGIKCYKFSCNVHAPQTDTPIVCQFVRGTLESDVFTYTVQDYLTKVQNNYQPGDKMYALGSSLATYGYCANALFDYNPDFVQHPLYDDSGFAAITAASLAAYEAQLDNDPAGVEYYGSSVVMKTETSIKHYFKLRSGQSLNDFTVLLGEGADAVELTPVISGGYYVVEIKNIGSGRLGNPYKVSVIENTTGDAVNTWIYSAMSYSHTVLTKYEANDPAVSAELAAAAKALVGYYQAAYAYFNQ